MPTVVQKPSPSVRPHHSASRLPYPLSSFHFVPRMCQCLHKGLGQQWGKINRVPSTGRQLSNGEDGRQLRSHIHKWRLELVSATTKDARDPESTPR